VFDAGADGLGAVVRAALQYQAATEVSQATVATLTDSSGGTAVAVANGKRALSGIPTITAKATVSGADLSPKAGLDTAVGAITNNVATLMAKAEEYRAAIGAGAPAFTDTSGGTVSGTNIVVAQVAALAAVTGASGNGAGAAAAQALNDVRGAVIATLEFVREVAVAVGVAPPEYPSWGFGYGRDSAARDVLAMPADTGTASAAGASSVLDVDADAWLLQVQTAVATATAVLNAVDAVAPKPAFVAA